MKKVEDIIKNTDMLNQEQVESIKLLFQTLLNKGVKYDSNEVENWLENKIQNKNIIIRITNLSHYIQTKHEQTSRFRVIPDESCDC